MEEYASPDWKVPDDSVIELTASSFEEQTDVPLILVEFYAPWCGHCKSLAPKLEVAAKRLHNLKIPVAKLDAAKYNALGQKYASAGYPTLKVFRFKKDYKFDADRESDAIVNEMIAQSRPAAEIIEDGVAMNLRAKKSTGLIVLALFQNGVTPATYIAMFEEVASSYRGEIQFAYSTHDKARAQYNVPANTILILQPPRMQTAQDIGVMHMRIDETTLLEGKICFHIYISSINLHFL